MVNKLIIIFSLVHLQNQLSFIYTKPVSTINHPNQYKVEKFTTRTFEGNHSQQINLFGTNTIISNEDEKYIPAHTGTTAESTSTLNCGNKSEVNSSSFLWRINTEPPSYLFGTLHVAYTHVWPFVAPTVKEAFDKAQLVYFELDLLDPTTLKELADCQMLPAGMNLTEILTPELVHHLESYINHTRDSIIQRPKQNSRSYNIYVFDAIAKDWKRKRPMWILLLLNTLTRGDIEDRGVPVLDLFLTQLSQQLAKQWGGVEAVADQCDPLNGVENEQAALALRMTLDRLETTRTCTKQGSAQNMQDSGLSTHNQKHPVNKLKLKLNHPDDDQPTSSYDIKDSIFNTNAAKRLVDQYNCGNLSILLSPTHLQQSIGSNLPVNFRLTPGSRLASPTTDTTRANKLEAEFGFSETSNQILPNLNRTEMKLLKGLEEYLNTELILKRNAKMAKRIMQKLDEARTQRKVAFFAVGAAHFIGAENTIIHHLRRAGYEVSEVPRTSNEAGQNIPEASFHETDTQDVDHLLRNRRKQTIGEELLSEQELPEFQPRFVNFENVWIRIEDFSPSMIASRRNHSRTRMNLNQAEVKSAQYEDISSDYLISSQTARSNYLSAGPAREKQEQKATDCSSFLSCTYCAHSAYLSTMYNFLICYFIYDRL